MPEVTISQEEYDSLIEDQAFLQALEEAGVDNWEGYCEAQRIFDEFNGDFKIAPPVLTVVVDNTDK